MDIDTPLFLALNGDWGGFFDQFFWLMSGKLTWIPLYLALMYAFWKRFGLRNMVLLCIGIVGLVVLADQIAGFFKHYTPRLRPTHTPEIQSLIHTVNGYRGGLYGTVSAHAATTWAIALFSSLVLRRTVWWIVLAVWVLLVVYSRIYLGAHYPLDILYGLVLGTVLAVVMYYAYGKRIVTKKEI